MSRGPRRRCVVCRALVPVSSFTDGVPECESCAGQMAFPLRGEKGRFLATKPAKSTGVQSR